MKLGRGPRAILLALSLAAVVYVIYRGTLSYPFIQDDWGILRELNAQGPWQWLTRSFLPVAGGFYRPLGRLYFALLWPLFGVAPAGYHVLALVLHTVNSILVASLAGSLTADRRVGLTAGFLYAGAATIHLDTLSWIVGCYDLLGALFFFLSIRFYLHGKSGLSLAAFAAAMLSKEATFILPVVLLFIILPHNPKERIRFSSVVREVRFLRNHFLLMALFGGLWYFLVRPGVTAAGGDPYAMSFTAANLAANLTLYVRWSFEYLHPWMPDAWNLWATLVALVVVGGISFALRRTTSSRLPLLAALWFIGGLLPVLPFTHHGFRYYLIYSFPAFGLIFGLLISTLTRSRKEVTGGVMLILIVVSLISAYRYCHELDALGFNTPTLDGSNNLQRKAAIVTMVHDHMMDKYPVLPERSICIFDWLPTVAFYGDAGPQIWYSDSTIHVFEIQQVGEDSLGLYRTDARGPRMYLKPAEAVLFEFHGDVLRSRVLFRGM